MKTPNKPDTQSAILEVTPRITQWITKWFIIVALLLAFSTSAQILFAMSADATFTVNTTGDGSDASPDDGLCATAAGDCTLRAAIEQANALGPDAAPHHIHFAIPNNGPHVIAPTAQLPDVTVPLVIDGATQAGATCPTATTPAQLQIVLDDSGGSVSKGLELDRGSDGSTVRGLVIGGFTTGIRIRSDNNRIECSHIGIGVDGTTDMGNGDAGISLDSGADNNVVGGDAAASQRNVIAGNDGEGVYLFGNTNNVIANNYIGTTADGLTALPNDNGGITLSSVNANTVGGKSPLARNVIGGNDLQGIRIIDGQSNNVWGNYIGVGSDGTTAIPNVRYGIEILGVSTQGNTIGGTSAGEKNVIAHNNLFGVFVLFGDQNPIRGNSIFGNGTLGIDLSGDGPDVNEVGDGDTGPNQHQNYPVLTSATVESISGTLASAPDQSYEIDFYASTSCHTSGYGEGEFYLGSVTTATDATGNASFSLDISSTTVNGSEITATATDADGNTSEFSACFTINVLAPPTATPTATATATPTAIPTREHIDYITDCTTAASVDPTASPTVFPTSAPTSSPTSTPGGTTPEANEQTYLPLISSTGNAERISAAMRANATGLLTDGGIVTGIDSVALGAIAGTLTTSLNISITQTAAPTQTLVGLPQAHGHYYHIAAEQNVFLCDRTKGFVLGLPIPDGVATTNLAIAAIDPTETAWVPMLGLYDEVSGLMLVHLATLTTAGNRVVLLEDTAFDSQQPSADATLSSSAATVGSASAQNRSGTKNFEVVCVNSYFSCLANGYILADFLKLLYIEFSDMGYNEPWLLHKPTEMSLVEFINGEDLVEYKSDPNTFLVAGLDLDAIACKFDPQKDLQKHGPGLYFADNRLAAFCFEYYKGTDSGTPLTNAQMRAIRHLYFHTLQFGYDDVVANYIANDHDPWVLESMATAAEISTPAKLESSNNFDRRPVDVPLDSVEHIYEFSAQDFWVYSGIMRKTGLSFIEGALSTPNAGTTEGTKDYFDAQGFLHWFYWRWVRNQTMLADDAGGKHVVLLNDDDTGTHCTYQDSSQNQYFDYDSQNPPLPGFTITLEPLTAHVVEFIGNPLLEGKTVTIWVRKAGEDPDNLDQKLRRVVFQEKGSCVAESTTIQTTDRWEFEKFSMSKKYYIVVANVDIEEKRQYDIGYDSRTP